MRNRMGQQLDPAASKSARSNKTNQKQCSGEFMELFGFGTKRQLINRRIAIIATQDVEQAELTSRTEALEKAGAVVELVSRTSS